jgi:hypothetical protein
MGKELVSDDLSATSSHYLQLISSCFEFLSNAVHKPLVKVYLRFFCSDGSTIT